MGCMLRSCLASGIALAWSFAGAVDKSFVAADGEWKEDVNWSPAGVPSVGDSVTIPKDKICRVGPGVATALVKTTVAAGGTLVVDGGALMLSDNTSSKQSLSVSGLFRLVSGSVAVHDLTIEAAGKAELPGGSLTVNNNMYNKAATTDTTGLHIGADVQLVKGYWNFNAAGGVIEGLNRCLGEIRLPTSTGGTGTLLVTNSTLTIDKLGIAYHESNRNNLTGSVTISDADVTLKALAIVDNRITGTNTRELTVGEGGVLSFVNSVGASTDATSSFRLQVGGVGVTDAKLIVTNAANEMKSVTMGLNSTLGIGPGAEVRANLYAAARGRILGTGGTIRAAKIGSANKDTADKAILSFNDMTVYATHIICGGSTVDGANKATDTTMTPTEMTFANTALKCATTYCYVHVGASATKNVARLVFDGCTMDPANGTNYKWYMRNLGTDTAEVIVKGAKNALYFQQIEGTAFKLEYVFEDGISPINLERENHKEAVGPAGHLYLTPGNGATLLPGREFDILTSRTPMDLAQKNFTSTPWSRGSTLWSGALANGGKSYRVTLNTSGSCVPGSGMTTLENPSDAGALEVPIGDLIGVASVEVLVGLSDGTTQTLSFPASSVKPNATNVFVWDYAGTAQVSGVRVNTKRAPEKFYLHFR